MTLTPAPSGETLRAVLDAIHRQYALPWRGLHGVTHWARVYENGLRLAPHTRADVTVLLYFALFHDARRTSEGWDQGHGRRGAQLAASLRGRCFDVAEGQFQLLVEACALHTDGLLEADPTVQTCWDADRLDLARAGIQPQPAQLCTEAARRSEIIAWATARSLARAEPEFLERAWLAPGSGVDAGAAP
jgi:uncharacterized protein